MPNKAHILAADIRQLEQWQRSQLPNFHNAETQAVIGWLMREQGRIKPLGELYQTPGYSNGALRGAVTLLAFNGLIDISRDIQDARRFLARPTKKLIRRMRMYAEKLQQVIQRYSSPVSAPRKNRLGDLQHRLRGEFSLHRHASTTRSTFEASRKADYPTDCFSTHEDVL